MVKKSKTTKYIRAIDTIIKFQQDDGIESLTISGKESLADLSIDKHGHTTLYLNADKDKIDELNSLVPFIDVKTSLNGDVKTVELSQNLKMFALELTTDSQQLAEIIKENDNITLDLSKLINLLNEHSERIEKAQRQAEIATEKADKAQETADTATEKADKAQETADTATEKADKAQETADTATEKADKAQETADTALAEIAKTNELVKQAQSSADKAQETADNNKKEIEETQKEVDDLQQTSNGLLEKIRKHNLEIEDTKALLSLTNNRMAENENRLNEAQENIEQLANEISEVNEQVEKNTLNIENISNEIKSQKERVDELYTKHAELVAKNGEQDQATLEALNKAEEAVLGVENLKKELENLNNTDNELRVKIGELNGQTQQLNETKDNILVLIGNLQKEKSKLENDLKTLEDLIKQVNDGLTITNQELGDKILKLNQLKEKQVELERILEELKNKKPVDNPNIVYAKVFRDDELGNDIKKALENNVVFKSNVFNTGLSTIDTRLVKEETKVIIRDKENNFYLGLIENVENNTGNFSIRPLVKLSNNNNTVNKNEYVDYTDLFVEYLDNDNSITKLNNDLNNIPYDTRENKEIHEVLTQQIQVFITRNDEILDTIDKNNLYHFLRLSKLIKDINLSYLKSKISFYDTILTDSLLEIDSGVSLAKVDTLTGKTTIYLDIEKIINAYDNVSGDLLLKIDDTSILQNINSYEVTNLEIKIDDDITLNLYISVHLRDYKDWGDGRIYIKSNYEDLLPQINFDRNRIKSKLHKMTKTIVLDSHDQSLINDDYRLFGGDVV